MKTRKKKVQDAASIGSTFACPNIWGIGKRYSKASKTAKDRGCWAKTLHMLTWVLFQVSLPCYFGFISSRSHSSASIYNLQLFSLLISVSLNQCLDGTQFSFPRAMNHAKKSGTCERLFQLYEEVKARPNLAADLASNRRQKYAWSIYRYYPCNDVLPGE